LRLASKGISVIASFCSALREDLDDDTLTAIALEVAGGVCCVVCGAALAGAVSGRANVVAFRMPGSLERAIHYADVSCAPSQLIDVAVLPDDDEVAGLIGRDFRGVLGANEDDVDGDAGERLSWALSSRTGGLPSIILALDLNQVEDLRVSGLVLLKALRIEGFCGGRDLETLVAPPTSRVTMSREGEVLSVHTRYGDEQLGLIGDPVLRDALHLAAVQREILLVVGVDLRLRAGSLDEVERQLQFSGAVAAAVPYSDPELARKPLWGSRRHRVGRRLLSITPSARRTRRAQRSR
jgi:hypothetical protein